MAKKNTVTKDAPCVHADERGRCANPAFEAAGVECLRCAGYAPRAEPAKAGDKVLKDIPVGELEPHIAASSFWPENEDRENDIKAIKASVKEYGIKNPLAVMPMEDGSGKYWVVDGCTRLEAAKEAGIKTVPCVVRPHIADERILGDEVFISNLDRTRFGTGFRIMKCLERNLDDVLKTARENADPVKTGAKGGRGNKGSVNDRAFTPAAFAARLNVSDKDVAGGIELLRCKYDDVAVRNQGRKRVTVEATDEDRKEADTAYDAALNNSGSLRAWQAASAGRNATKGEERKGTDVYETGKAHIRGLKALFKEWFSDQLEGVDRDFLIGLIGKALDAAPPDVAAMLTKRYGK